MNKTFVKKNSIYICPKCEIAIMRTKTDLHSGTSTSASRFESLNGTIIAEYKKLICPKCKYINTEEDVTDLKNWLDIRLE